MGFASGLVGGINRFSTLNAVCYGRSEHENASDFVTQTSQSAVSRISNPLPANWHCYGSWLEASDTAVKETCATITRHLKLIAYQVAPPLAYREGISGGDLRTPRPHRQ